MYHYTYGATLNYHLPGNLFLSSKNMQDIVEATTQHNRRQPHWFRTSVDSEVIAVKHLESYRSVVRSRFISATLPELCTSIDRFIAITDMPTSVSAPENVWARLRPWFKERKQDIVNAADGNYYLFTKL